MDIIMSEKEIFRLSGIQKVADGEWSLKKASRELSMCKRQLIRLTQRYRQGGAAATTHRNRGRSSSKKISDVRRREVLELICNHYEDFGPTLIAEQLEERHGIRFSKEWIRKLLIEEGIRKVSKRKELSLHQRRPRRLQEGELEQMDGSYADWFEGRGPPCCLLVIIDDATSKLQELLFAKHETREDYFLLMKRYIKRRGRPLAIYTDRHSIFKSTNKQIVREPTQFGRAMKELEIELIHANSPQAKGRVERANSTLQDRLIKLMRLEGISNMEEGNIYLEKFRENYNRRFAKRPVDLEDAHRQLPHKMVLDKILCVKEKRKLSKQLTLQYENRCYQIKPNRQNSRRLVGAVVWIVHSSGGLIIEHEGKACDYTLFEDTYVDEPVMDRRTVMAFLNRKQPMTMAEKYRKGIATNF